MAFCVEEELAVKGCELGECKMEDVTPLLVL